MKIRSILLFNKWQSLFLFNPRSVFTIVETMTRAAISSSKRKRSFYAQLKTWRNYKLPLRHFLASSSLGRYTLWWKRWACFHVAWSARCCIAETLSFFLHVLIDCVSLYLMKRSRIFLFTPLGRLFRFSARCVSSASTLQMPVRLEVWIAVWRSIHYWRWSVAQDLLHHQTCCDSCVFKLSFRCRCSVFRTVARSISSSFFLTFWVQRLVACGGYQELLHV